jgi:Zn-dependent M28 family amino/carboxypeptidase
VVDDVLATEGLVLGEAPNIEMDGLFRSDHYRFARRGVPGLSIAGGLDFVDRPAGWGPEQVEDFLKNRYHDPSDEIAADFRYDGAVQQARFLIRLGWRLAGPTAFPSWHENSVFWAAGQALRGSR